MLQPRRNWFLALSPILVGVADRTQSCSMGGELIARMSEMVLPGKKLPVGAEIGGR